MEHGTFNIYNMGSKVFIYVLIDPKTDEVRYVGKTNSLSKRLYNHISTARKNKSKSHKNNWINGLLNESLSPKIEIIDEVPEDMWEIFEIYWIDQFRQWGFKLTNVCEGGEGAKTGKRKPLSKEHRKSISDSVKQRAKENPLYNRGLGNSRIYLDKYELYQKYIIENLSLNKCSVFFGVSKKTVFTNITEYGYKKDKKDWEHQLATQPKKIVLQYDKSGKLVKEWVGLSIIQEEIGVNKSNIANCCRGVVKSAGGFIWKYKNQNDI